MSINRYKYINELVNKRWNGKVKPWIDENGITYAGVIPFLLDETVLNI